MNTTQHLILVTGASGTIGQKLIDSLQARGANFAAITSREAHQVKASVQIMKLMQTKGLT